MLNIISLLFPKRFSLLKSFSSLFLITSFLIRTGLYVWSFNQIEFSALNLIKIIGIGFLYDLGTLAYILAIYGIYWFLFPKKFYGNWLDKTLVYVTYFLLVFIFVFAFLGELTFWQEFARRYNFIAVDYLLYTYEVVENINESYPIPVLIGIMLLMTSGAFFIAKRQEVFIDTFNNKDGYLKKIIPYGFWILIAGFFHLYIQNNQAEIFNNRYENELAKSGVFSFFAAYNANELEYDEFYKTQPKDASLKIVQESLLEKNGKLLTPDNILRTVHNTGKEQKPNIVFICMESLNANFMESFGNQKLLTPFLDSLAQKSVFYTNLHATGTRTIRGMEAITLAIPPTPGRSIVKRPNNNNLFTIGEILKEKGYSRTFFYGGDGYFDNMNGYFGNNGFDIVDNPKDKTAAKDFPTQRTIFTENDITFENAWGACDGDIYNKAIEQINLQHKSKKPFFNFIMTNTNHRPYTFPEGAIKDKPGSRIAAIRYADWAMKRFFNDAQQQPWFKNTVFVIMSDHCAYSAGRTELDVTSYHIPAMIYNLPNTKPTQVNKLCSQIDILPTLFGYLNWSYPSKIFGKDISKMSIHDERAFIANHRKLGYRKRDKVLILNETKGEKTYTWNSQENKLTAIESDINLTKETIANYQTAYELFKNNKLKIE